MHSLRCRSPPLMPQPVVTSVAQWWAGQLSLLDLVADAAGIALGLALLICHQSWRRARGTGQLQGNLI